MTIKDGFKLGLGFIFAQIVVSAVVVALSLPVLYVIGATVKDKVTSTILGLPSDGK
jgi:hypothetical protein